MDIDLKENLNNFIEKNVEIFLDVFFKCNYVIYQFNYSIEGEILNIMDVMFIANINGFSKLLLEMLKVFYKWKKVLQITKPELTFGLEDEILEIVENNSIENIIYLLTCSPNLIEIIITDFLEYETNDMILKSEIEKLYETLVSREIKIKLKEV